jgi:hypothetical protein
VQRYEFLEAWVQWPSLHTGLSASEHSVFRLGDIVNSWVPQIFEWLEKQGLRIGWIAVLNAENRLEDSAYFIPDPLDGHAAGQVLVEQSACRRYIPSRERQRQAAHYGRKRVVPAARAGAHRAAQILPHVLAIVQAAAEARPGPRRWRWTYCRTTSTCGCLQHDALTIRPCYSVPALTFNTTTSSTHRPSERSRHCAILRGMCWSGRLWSRKCCRSTTRFSANTSRCRTSMSSWRRDCHSVRLIA